MTPDDPRHGKVAGYVAGCHETCCRTVIARYEQSRLLSAMNGRPLTIPGIGTSRRLQALAALGWSFVEIAARLDCDKEWPRRWAKRGHPTIHRSTAEKIDRVYRELCMTLPPEDTTQQKSAASRVRTVARRNGWVPPLAWDNIDTDPEPVDAPHLGLTEDSIDEAVVERMLASGERTRKLTAGEAELVVRRALARGMSTLTIREVYGIKPERYIRVNDPEVAA